MDLQSDLNQISHLLRSDSMDYIEFVTEGTHQANVTDTSPMDTEFKRHYRSQGRFSETSDGIVSEKETKEKVENGSRIKETKETKKMMGDDDIKVAMQSIFNKVKEFKEELVSKFRPKTEQKEVIQATITEQKGGLTVAPSSLQAYPGKTSSYQGSKTRKARGSFSGVEVSTGRNRRAKSTYMDDLTKQTRLGTETTGRSGQYAVSPSEAPIIESPATTERKKRQPPMKLLYFIDIAKKIQEKGNYDPKELKHKNFMAIAKLVWQDAQKQAGPNSNNEAIFNIALRLADNANKYIERYRMEQKQNNRVPAARVRQSSW